MNLQKIIDRLVEGLLYIDQNTTIIESNRRTGEIYHIGAILYVGEIP